MAAFVQDLQATFDATVRAVRSSDPVASLFQSSDGKGAAGGHFKPGDANYMIGDFIGVVGAPSSSRYPDPTALPCGLTPEQDLMLALCAVSLMNSAACVARTGDTARWAHYRRLGPSSCSWRIPVP